MDMLNEDDLKKNVDNLKFQINNLKNNNSSGDIDPAIIEMITHFDYLYEKATDREKKALVHSLIDEIILLGKYDLAIKYKNLGLLGWRLQDEIHITSDKKSFSKEEIERILKKHIG